MNNVLKDRINLNNNLSFMESLDLFALKLAKDISSMDGTRKIFICGNGGSASQASHFAAELMVRYKKKRNSFFAIALSADGSIISAISNDYSYEDVFSMQLENMASKNDVLIALSTSGGSENVNRALKYAQQNEIITYALLGKDGGSAVAENSIIVPSYDTAIIQEFHLTIIHMVCEYLEQR